MKFRLFKNPSLKARIFTSMILLTLISSILIALMAIYQFNSEAKKEHQERLIQRENAVLEHIRFILNTSPFELTTKNLALLFKDKIYELSTIHNIQIDLHDLEGNLLLSSVGNFTTKGYRQPTIAHQILDSIQFSANKRHLSAKMVKGSRYFSVFNYIKDHRFKPLGIVNLPYKEQTDFYEAQTHNFLVRFGQTYLFILLISIALAYLLSSFITQKLQLISEHIKNTAFSKTNKKIQIKNATSEIKGLISSYNKMVDQLKDSAEKLAQNEREQAWREMAKQVAHEIKNPLTPMRLSVQSFERRFCVSDPNIETKLKDFSSTLIQQIDTMSAVAGAFSSFASMPAQQNETLELVKVVQLALEIFNEDYIVFKAQEKEIITTFDRSQIIRVLTNLVKNAIQSMDENQKNPKIFVRLYTQQNRAIIEVQDNGTGIAKEIQDRIFEPQFTTKSSGMGLGLPMIKNIVESYGGSINFKTSSNTGTTFYVKLPIIT